MDVTYLRFVVNSGLALGVWNSPNSFDLPPQLNGQVAFNRLREVDSCRISHVPSPESV